MQTDNDSSLNENDSGVMSDQISNDYNARQTNSSPNNYLITLLGHNFQPDFHLRRQLKPFNLSHIEAQTLFFISIVEPLNTADLAILNKLLTACDDNLYQTQQHYTHLVVPRLGTLSPWSSKATDITKQCGLHQITRIERGILWALPELPASQEGVIEHIYDRMTETVLIERALIEHLLMICKCNIGGLWQPVANEFGRHLGIDNSIEPPKAQAIDLLQQGESALHAASQQMGLALSAEEIIYLLQVFEELGRNPMDIELMMFAQINSEHCRHKNFNRAWIIDQKAKPKTLFEMIHETTDQAIIKPLSAYQDNAAVINGYHGSRFFADPKSHHYNYHQEHAALLIKVETHNHPTAIAPWAGAATGVGGEIRDEAATGRGAKPKAGLCGFCVSDLHIPNFIQPWENNHDLPTHIASAYDIMLAAPLGAAAYGNQFGRPTLCGYFRTFTMNTDTKTYAYYKPIMLAGGYGVVRPYHVFKQPIAKGTHIVVLGGAAMLIGLGGGASSSMNMGDNDAELDFASVQRSNPDVQRRCQEVIDQCWALDEQNPIQSIHDVGSGGLSNALPELIYAGDNGINMNLRDIPVDNSNMSPLEIWCNESQERYVLAIQAEDLPIFEKLCQRERTPYAVLGQLDDSATLILKDDLLNQQPVDFPLVKLLGKLPLKEQQVTTVSAHYPTMDTNHIDFAEALDRVLHLPAVASKQFLITIADRSVSGLIYRDQMVGAWQVPVADCAVSFTGYRDYTGEAMAIGERSPIAVIDVAASARMAIGEAITNLCAARVTQMTDIALSANWMAACGEAGEDAKLYNAVEALRDVCVALNIPIPVGKDSLSMKTVWQQQQAHSPVSLNISAFARVADIRLSLSPELQAVEDSVLLLIDLAAKQRLGGSALSQVYDNICGDPPDMDAPQQLKTFFTVIQNLNERGYLLAYHDRSDGGLITTLLEMSFASQIGLTLTLPDQQNATEFLFNEELGAVIQIHAEDELTIINHFEDLGLGPKHIHTVAHLNKDKQCYIQHRQKTIFSDHINALQQAWAETSYRMQSLRDDPDCARQEYDEINNLANTGLFLSAEFELLSPPNLVLSKPRVAILREQGVNGQVEMAAAFDQAGFECTDVHMQDLIANHTSLADYQGLAVCGGFSYGDVLGAGRGWANTILLNEHLCTQFSQFFERDNTFTLGICNGCQMLVHLRDLMPNSEHFPTFLPNYSGQFEARLVMVEIMPSKSILLTDMAGAMVPVVVSHAEGRTNSEVDHCHAVLRYVDYQGITTQKYPANPNGSPQGLTGFSSTDGRITIMMPHPERVFLSKQFSWLPKSVWQKAESPWFRLFQNAYQWCQTGS